MATNKSVFKQIFTDHKGKLSSKRTITLVAFLLVCIAFIANLMFSIPMKDFIFNGMVYIVGGGLGFSAVEYFGSKSKKEASDDVEDTELLEE